MFGENIGTFVRNIQDRILTGLIVNEALDEAEMVYQTNEIGMQLGLKKDEEELFKKAFAYSVIRSKVSLFRDKTSILDAKRSLLVQSRHAFGKVCRENSDPRKTDYINQAGMKVNLLKTPLN